MESLKQYLTSESINEAIKFNIPKAAVKKICDTIYDLISDERLDLLFRLPTFREGWWKTSTIEALLTQPKIKAWGWNYDEHPYKEVKNLNLECEFGKIEFGRDREAYIIPNKDAIMKTLTVYGGGELSQGADAVGTIIETGDEVMCSSLTTVRAGKMIRSIVKKITPSGKVSTEAGTFDPSNCLVIVKNGKSIDFKNL